MNNPSFSLSVYDIKVVNGYQLDGNVCHNNDYKIA